MSALQKVKAYFGMVPAEDYDDPYGEYGDYQGEFAEAHGYAAEDYHGRDLGRRDPRAEPGMRRSSFGPAPERRPHRVEPGGYPADEDNGRERDVAGYRDDSVAQVRPLGLRRPYRAEQPAGGGGGEHAVRGSLAVDQAHHPRPVAEPAADPHPLGRITTLHPKNYNEARTIGERYREGNPVIMNLTEMPDADAKRLVDFAAGLAFALRGSMDKVTNKVFLISPPDVDVSAEDKRLLAEGRYQQA